MNDATARHEAVRAAMDALAQAPMFHNLTNGMLRQVAEHARPARFEEGEVIYRQGDASTSMLVIGSGTVAVCRDKVELALLTSGDTVGEVGAVLAGPRMATVVARSEVSGYAISKEGLDMAFVCDGRLKDVVQENIIGLTNERLGIANRKNADLTAEALQLRAEFAAALQALEELRARLAMAY